MFVLRYFFLLLIIRIRNRLETIILMIAKRHSTFLMLEYKYISVY